MTLTKRSKINPEEAPEPETEEVEREREVRWRHFTVDMTTGDLHFDDEEAA